MSKATRPPRFLQATAPKKDRLAFPAPQLAPPQPEPQAPAAAPPPAPPPPPAEPEPEPAPLRRAEARAPELDAAGAARIAAAVDALRLEAARLAEQARSDALEIGFQVARRILELELTASPQPLFALIRSAVRRAGEARTLAVRLSPRDAERVRAAGSDRAAGELAVAKVEIVADPDLGTGDCVVETELGTVDGRLSTRLDELRRAADVAIAEGAA
ncbi:MAG TPA: FliH/SctL family protein [Myxococcales bacterium]|nr:FliH/SctL family protein [Myxococcales bacterium]